MLNNKININIYIDIMCIDDDIKDDDVKYFNQLINKYEFPVVTPYQNCGLHYIFKYKPNKLTNKKIGVDFWFTKVKFVDIQSINKLTKQTKDNIPDWVFDNDAINDDYEIIDEEETETKNCGIVSNIINSISNLFY